MKSYQVYCSTPAKVRVVLDHFKGKGYKNDYDWDFDNYATKYPWLVIEPNSKSIGGNASAMSYLATIDFANVFDIVETPVILKRVQFVYRKSSYEVAWRTLDVIQEDSEYVTGLDVDDNNKFKKFSKDKILGGKLITV